VSLGSYNAGVLFRRKERTGSARARSVEWLRATEEFYAAGPALNDLSGAIMWVHSLGVTGSEDSFARFADAYRIGRALRATIADVPIEPLPTEAFDEAAVRRLAARPFADLLADEEERAALQGVAVALEPFYQGRFDEILSVDHAVWALVENQLKSSFQKRGVSWKSDASQSPLRVGFALRAMEEAFGLPAGTVPPDGQRMSA